MSTPLFSGVTANQVATASLPYNTPGDCEASFYASGPASGTWTARVDIWEKRGDGELASVWYFLLSNSTPNLGGTGVRTYDQQNLFINGGSIYLASVTLVTGTIPAPGLYAESR